MTLEEIMIGSAPTWAEYHHATGGPLVLRLDGSR